MDPKLIALLPFTLLLAISTFLLWKLLPGTKPFDYGLAIDAGSSHSEVILYKWSEKINGTGHAEQIASSEISTGIDDHGEDIESAVSELYTAVDSIVSQIPSDAIPPFPLFLGATAGIRILNLTKPKLVDRMMDNINRNLSESTFSDGRSLKVKQVRILTGTEEGLYAWVTANYLLNFKPNEEDQSLYEKLIPSTEMEINQKKQLNTSLHTIGILDMGGASAQIAYQTVDSNKDQNDQSVNPVTLFGETYKIKSHSNLCFGSDQAYFRYLFELFRIQLTQDGIVTGDIMKNLSLTVHDPCNYDSPIEMYQVSEFLSNPCLKTFRPVSDVDLSNVTVVYEPSMNHSKCASMIIDLIDEDRCDLVYHVCPTSHSDRFPNGNHFYATSSYYFSAKVLNSLQNGADSFENDTHYLEQVNHWCTTQWTEKIQLSDLKYARYLCFKQLYIYYTLKTIYQLTDDHWPYIHFRNTIGSSSLSWSLGYMLAETNVIPAKPTRPLIWPEYAFYVSIGLVICTCLFLVIYWIGKRSKSAVINQKA